MKTVIRLRDGFVKASEVIGGEVRRTGHAIFHDIPLVDDQGKIKDCYQIYLRLKSGIEVEMQHDLNDEEETWAIMVDALKEIGFDLDLKSQVYY